MLKRIRHWIAPPLFNDNPEKTRAAALLNVILLALLGMTLIYVVFTPIDPALLGRRISIVGPLLLSLASLVWAMRRGHVRFASTAVVAAMWLAFTAAMAYGGGYNTPAFMGYAVVTVCAGLLLGRRATFLWALAGMIASALILMADQIGLLPPPDRVTNGAFWVAQSVFLLTTALMLSLTMRRIDETMARAQTELAERCQAEERLRESEERYRLISSVMSDYTFSTEVGPQGELKHNLVGGAFEAITGYAPEEFAAVGGWRAILHPDDVAQDERDMAGIYANQKVTTEVRIIKKGGEVRWVRVYGQPVWDTAHNRPAGIYGAVQDITERKQAEEALQQSEALYRRAIEAAGAVPYYRDYRLNSYTFIGEGIAQITGYSAAEMTPTLWDSLEQEAHPRGVLAGLSLAEAQSRARAGQVQQWECDSRIRTRDGQSRWVADASVQVRDEHGARIGVIGIVQDITARKEAEAALRASELRFRTLVENLPDIVTRYDRQLRYVYISPVIASLNRLPPDDFVGRTNRELDLPLELTESMEQTLPSVFETGQSLEFEFSFDNARGHRVYYESRAVPEFAADGTVQSVLTLNRNVTNRKHSEDALRQSEALYRRAIEAAGAVPYYLDYQTETYRFMGKGIQQLIGIAANEMRPGTWDSVTEERHLLGELASLPWPEAIRRKRTGAASIWQCDYLVRTADGRQRWLTDAAVQDFDEQGNLRGSIGILIDITDRRLALAEAQKFNIELERRVAERTEALRTSEARMRAMNDSSPLGVFFDNVDGQCVYTNATYQAILGLSSDEALGTQWMNVLHPDDSEWVSAAVQAAHSRQQAFDLAHRYQRADGRVVWVSVKGAPVRVDDQVLGYVGTVEDITARVNAEEALKRRSAQLEAANQELESFSYSVSHDLRAPVRAIGGFSHLLLQRHAEGLPPEAVHYLERVHHGAQYMGQLIDDLLAFARLGRQALRIQRLTADDLSALVNRSVADLRVESPDRSVEVIIHDLPPCNADVALLKQVLINLLSNAFKFTQSRPVARIEVGSAPAPGGQAYYVRDNGVGFDMRFAHKLFNVFQRLHRSEEFEGTGVGLAIVQRIIHKHGGRIWAEAEVDKGAAVYFTLGNTAD